MKERQKKIQILTSAVELFMKFGIKSQTMDDVAKHLGISKKTLYLHVKDKKDLVKKSVDMMIKHEQEFILSIMDGSKTAIDQLIGITQCISSKLGDLHPSVIYDLQKYHIEGWKILEKHKQKFVHSIMLENLKRGVKEGFYRKNLNPDVVAGIYVTMVDASMNPDNPMLKKMTLEQLMLEVINYHLKGISSEKGIAYLKEALKKGQGSKLFLD